MRKRLPVECPSCGQALRAARLRCPACTTAVEGEFALPLLARLNDEDQLFVQHLVTCSGSLKDLASLYGVSYPTVRNRLDGLIARIKELETGNTNAPREEDRP